MHGIGHNSGKVDEPGKAWRTYAWRKARQELMPKLPIEVIRLRVKRAKELGLPYKTYAGLRAASGDDLIGFMFSSNALDVLKRGDDVPAAKANKLGALVGAKTVCLTHAPVASHQVSPPADVAASAPRPLASWADHRMVLKDVFVQSRMTASRIVLISDQSIETEWVSAGRMAGSISTEVFFAP